MKTKEKLEYYEEIMYLALKLKNSDNELEDLTTLGAVVREALGLRPKRAINGKPI